MEHKFGGPHTEVKLDVLERYLNAYQQALSNQPFKKIYIDPFAGTGDRVYERKESPLFGQPAESITLPGSARRSLDIKIPFDRYIFADQKKTHFEALTNLKEEYSSTHNITCFHGDANEVIPSVVRSIDWWSSRAVTFLDPYGLEIEWKTVQTIADTKRIDVLFLVSLSGLYRQAANKMINVDEDKARRLDTFLGTTTWRDTLYQESRPDLLSNTQTERVVNWEGINAFVKDRLENVFSHVENPIVLFHRGGAPLYSLFYGISNPAPKAIGLGKNIFKHLRTSLGQ